ncbi:MAG: hypothetical protein LBI19_11095 [Oscillospiraceae bacterium]|jgi:hypothetical protein|nr:hypothetical protein [Oscillospiraceae bacterium]
MIQSSALKVEESDEIITGVTHADCWIEAVLLDLTPGEKGFITTDGRYVDRSEAYEIASAHGQLKDRPRNPETLGQLYSEDLIFADGSVAGEEKE